MYKESPRDTVSGMTAAVKTSIVRNQTETSDCTSGGMPMAASTINSVIFSKKAYQERRDALAFVPKEGNEVSKKTCESLNALGIKKGKECLITGTSNFTIASALNGNVTVKQTIVLPNGAKVVSDDRRALLNKDLTDFSNEIAKDLATGLLTSAITMGEGCEPVFKGAELIGLNDSDGEFISTLDWIKMNGDLENPVLIPDVPVKCKCTFTQAPNGFVTVSVSPFGMEFL